MIRYMRAWWRALRFHRRRGASLYERWKRYDPIAKAAYVERVTYRLLAPIAGQVRRCRIIKMNAYRPWVEFVHGPTIQRRRTWIRDAA